MNLKKVSVGGSVDGRKNDLRHTGRHGNLMLDGAMQIESCHRPGNLGHSQIQNQTITGLEEVNGM